MAETDYAGWVDRGDYEMVRAMGNLLNGLWWTSNDDIVGVYPLVETGDGVKIGTKGCDKSVVAMIIKTW